MARSAGSLEFQAEPRRHPGVYRENPAWVDCAQSALLFHSLDDDRPRNAEQARGRFAMCGTLILQRSWSGPPPPTQHHPTSSP